MMKLTKYFDKSKEITYIIIIGCLLLCGCATQSTLSNSQLVTEPTTESTAETTAESTTESKGTHTWVVNTLNQSIQINKDLWGVFFEDINYGADQGLYAEMVQNRSFEVGISSWYVDGRLGDPITLVVANEKPLNKNNTKYLSLELIDKTSYIYNQGLTAMAFKEGYEYNVSLYLREGNTKASVEVSFMDHDKRQLSEWVQISRENRAKDLTENSLGIISKDSGFEKHSIRLKASGTTNRGRLVLRVQGNIDLDMISLMPVDTFKNQENGMRIDLATMIEQIAPSFFRFPGGCIVEGSSLDNAYQWKDTIGDIAQRKENANLWGYQQSYGIGFYEYFRFCEDINTEPLPVINAGMACQARTNECVPFDQLEPYIQDALDLIEFANGTVDSTWGSIRAEMGHPEPFQMKYLAIGNEQWGSDYYFRYDKFAEAIRKSHPEIKLIFAAGPIEGGLGFDSAWRYAKAHEVDLVDEHYYMTPDWFFTNTQRYDVYDRNGPGVFIGEYAAHSGTKQNDMLSALAEAAFMTGIERNADIIELASYAPLLAYEKKAQWSPDLIWFDNDQSYATPNYYVQQLFSLNRGSAYLENKLTLAPSDASVKSISDSAGIKAGETQVKYDPVYTSSVVEENGDLILKYVNATQHVAKIHTTLNGLSNEAYIGSKTLLAGKTVIDRNSLYNPNKIIPQVTEFRTESNAFELILEPYSLTLIRLSQGDK
jgi:alpha-L-arabinofuranosidase